jgi:hypothetical protein
MLYLVCGIVEAPDDDATLHAVYHEHRAAIWHGEHTADGPSAPFAFWLYDQRVPEALRVLRSEAGAVAVDDLDRRERMAERRAQWLRAHWDPEQPFGGLA